jgi:hypothetical protein
MQRAKNQEEKAEAESTVAARNICWRFLKAVQQ